MDILDENGLAAVWLASTLEKKLKRKDIQDVNVEEAAKQMLRPKAGPLPLRMEGQLMYGLAQILNHRAKYLLQDSTDTDRNLVSLFSGPNINMNNKRRKNPSATMASQPTQVLDLMPQEFDLGQVLAGLNRGSDDINSSSPPAEENMDYDQSIDAIVRGDSDPVADELVPMSAADQSALGGLNLLQAFDDDLNQPMDGFDNEDEMADLTVDITNNYSSSPAPEANTPEAEELEVEIADENAERSAISLAQPKKRSAPTKTRLAPVDETTTLALPAKPPMHILKRNLPKLADDTLDLPSFGKDVAGLLDVDTIAIEMTRRRLLGDDTFEADEAVDEEYDYHVQLDSQDDMMEPADMEVEPVLEAGKQESELPLADAAQQDADTFVSSQGSEVAETDAAEARRALMAALDRASSPVDFNAITSGPRDKAAAFSELLIMTANGAVRTDQASAYGPIFIST